MDMVYLSEALYGKTIYGASRLISYTITDVRITNVWEVNLDGRTWVSVDYLIKVNCWIEV